MPLLQDQLNEIEQKKRIHKQSFSRLYRFYSIYSFCQIVLVSLSVIAAGVISVNVYFNNKEPYNIGETIWFIICSLWLGGLAVGFLYVSIFDFLISLLFTPFKVKEKDYTQFSNEREDLLKKTIDVKKRMKLEKTKKPIIVPVTVDNQMDSLPLDEQLKKVELCLFATNNAYPNYKKIEKFISDDFSLMLTLGYLVNIIIAVSYFSTSAKHYDFWQIAGAFILCFFPGYIPAMIFGAILYHPFVFFVKFLFGIPHYTYVIVKDRINSLESQKRSLEVKIEKERQAVRDRITYQKRQQELAIQRQFEIDFLNRVSTFLDDLQKNKYSVADATPIRNSIQDDYIQIKKVGFQNHNQVYYTNRLEKIDTLVHGKETHINPAHKTNSTQLQSNVAPLLSVNLKSDEKASVSSDNTINFIPPPIPPKPYIPAEKQEKTNKNAEIFKSKEEKPKPIPKEEVKTVTEVFGEPKENTEVTKEIEKTNQQNHQVKIDFQKLNQHRHNIGERGELYIFEKEQNHLISQGKINHIKEVVHVSLKSDSEGYDIISFTDTGERKYIEVKTTTGNEFEPFYLSTSEMEALKRLNNYWIYRVYNFNLDLGKGDLYKIDCSKELNTHYYVNASEYKVSPKR